MRSSLRRILILGLAITLALQMSCRDSYWVKLSGPVTISDEWIELRAQSPLKAEKSLQYVELELEPPFKDDYYSEGNGPNRGKGIIMPDGEIINPDIEVIDQYGNSFKLVYGGSRGHDLPIYNLKYPQELPRDREYKSVRIRSDRQINCKTVYWFCDSVKDWK